MMIYYGTSNVRAHSMIPDITLGVMRRDASWHYQLVRADTTALLKECRGMTQRGNTRKEATTLTSEIS